MNDKMDEIEVLETRDYVLNLQIESCSAEIVRLEQLIDDYIKYRANIANNCNDKNKANYLIYLNNLRIRSLQMEITRINKKTKRLMELKNEISDAVMNINSPVCKNI